MDLLCLVSFIFGLLLCVSGGEARSYDDSNREKKINIAKMINKNLVRYGEYCGPGPDDSNWSHLKPVDEIDEACYEHDIAYGSCYKNLAKDLGYNPPKWINQVMALRGFLPKIVQFYVNKYNPTYFECMHQADKIMVKKFNAIHDGERLPSWWQKHGRKSSSPSLYSSDGNHGCIISLNDDICVLSISDMFKIAIGTFTKNLDTDTEFLENKTFIDEHSMSINIAASQQRASDNITTGDFIYNGIINYYYNNFTTKKTHQIENHNSKHYKKLYEQDIIISNILGSSVYL